MPGVGLVELRMDRVLVQRNRYHSSSGIFSPQDFETLHTPEIAAA